MSPPAAAEVASGAAARSVRSQAEERGFDYWASPGATGS